jgi:hypothetical protein
MAKLTYRQGPLLVLVGNGKMRLRFQDPYNKSFHLTKPLGTYLAGARPAPNDFAGEPNVI